MDKIDIGDKNDLDKDSVSNEELKSKIDELSEKIEMIGKQLRSFEEKFDRLKLSDLSKSSAKDDVEIEEQDELEEDFLTPNELMYENEAIRNTGMNLIPLRIATAGEIAIRTGKDRAVESMYLNDLWNRNKIRKLRIGRKIYFYISKSKDIMPFKHSLIKPEWRDVLISIFRDRKTDFAPGKTVKLKLKDIVKDYFESTESEVVNTGLTKEDETRITKTLQDILKLISDETSFLTYDAKNEKIDFIIDEWLKLA